MSRLESLERLPDSLKEKIFSKVMEKASIARMTREEWWAYEQSLKYERDYHNTIEYAKEQARIEGLQEGREKGIKEGREVGREVGKELGRELGIMEGRLEGERQALRDVAISMKKKGLSNNLILEILKMEESTLREILIEADLS